MKMKALYSIVSLKLKIHMTFYARIMHIFRHTQTEWLSIGEIGMGLKNKSLKKQKQKG